MRLRLTVALLFLAVAGAAGFLVFHNAESWFGKPEEKKAQDKDHDHDHDEKKERVELTPQGLRLRRQALKIPPAVVERLGVELAELEHLHEVLTGINAAALSAGALDAELDR